MKGAGFARAALLALGLFVPSWAMAAHVHPEFHELIVVFGGELETKIKGQVIRGLPGQALYYPSGEWHSERAVGDTPLETFFLAWREPTPPAMPLRGDDRGGRILMLARWMLEIKQSGPAHRSPPRQEPTRWVTELRVAS